MLNTYVLYHALASLAAFDNRAVLPHPPGPYTTNGDRQLERIYDFINCNCSCRPWKLLALKEIHTKL